MADYPHESSPVDRTSGVASKYAMRPPARLPITPRILLQQAGSLASTFWVLTRHTLWPFEDSPKPHTPLTREQPLGSISKEMLQVCQHVADVATARLNKLESKANGLLALIAVVLPLSASAAVFIRSNTLPGWLATITVVVYCLALASFLLALWASLRALAVQGWDELFLNAVIDPKKDAIREYDADFFGRGLLHVASSAQAMCDHIANFVRAAQVFLVAGVVLTSIAAAPVLFLVQERAQRIEGTVAIHPESLTSIKHDAEAQLADATARITRLELELQSLRENERATRLQAELDALRIELAELRKQTTPK